MRKYRKHRKYTKKHRKNKLLTNYTFSFSTVLIGFIPLITISIIIFSYFFIRTTYFHEAFQGFSLPVPSVAIRLPQVVPEINSIKNQTIITIHSVRFPSFSFPHIPIKIPLPSFVLPHLTLPAIVAPQFTFPGFILPSLSFPQIDWEFVGEKILQILSIPTQIWLSSTQKIISGGEVVIQLLILLNPLPGIKVILQIISVFINTLFMGTAQIIQSFLAGIRQFFHTLFLPLDPFFLWLHERTDFNMDVAHKTFVIITPFTHLLSLSFQTTLNEILKSFQDTFSVF